MKQIDERQEYQEVEALSHLESEPFPNDSTEPEGEPMTVQDEPLMVRSEPLDFPISRKDAGEALGISGTMIRKYLEQLEKVYRDFPQFVLTNKSKRVTELGYNAIAKMKNSPLNGQDYLKELRQELTGEVKTVPSSAISIVKPGSLTYDRYLKNVSTLELQAKQVLQNCQQTINRSNQRFSNARSIRRRQIAALAVQDASEDAQIYSQIYEQAFAQMTDAQANVIAENEE